MSSHVKLDYERLEYEVYMIEGWGSRAAQMDSRHSIIGHHSRLVEADIPANHD